MKRTFQDTVSGFTLIEVIIAVAIVSVGLVMILQGFVSSLNAVKISEDTLKACIMADDRMAYSQLESENSPEFVLLKPSEYFMSGRLDFSWEFVAEVVDMPGTENAGVTLFKALSDLKWSGGKRKGDIKIETLFRQKKEIPGL
ncbi:MAG: prepilin-type N-terminal cleavage/methylation domain-containing protein [bacterium]|nr:prepilin-type N-terminal cleavage/methylation domain-containing protein [bacterium]